MSPEFEKKALEYLEAIGTQATEGGKQAFEWMVAYAKTGAYVDIWTCAVLIVVVPIIAFLLVKAVRWAWDQDEEEIGIPVLVVSLVGLIISTFIFVTATCVLPSNIVQYNHPEAVVLEKIIRRLK